MILNSITIILSSVVILMAIITPFVNPFFRFRKANANKDIAPEDDELSEGQTESDENHEDGDEPTKEKVTGQPITVLITAHENAAELERHLPQFL